MTKRHSKLPRHILVVGALLLVAFPIQFTRYIPIPAALATALWTLRNAIQLTLMMLWCVSLKRRIVSVPLRRMLLGVGALLGLWLTLRVCKWEYLLSPQDPLGRYCWYGFYVPMILIPLLGVFIADHIGKPEGHRSPRWMRLLYIPAALMLYGVFTNDLHRLVFTFPVGVRFYNHTYGYGALYYVIAAWVLALSGYFVVMLLKKCRVPGSRKFQKLPVLILMGTAVFGLVYCLGLQDCDMTAINCLMITALLESAIQGGLLPANSHYHMLFRLSTCSMQIVDEAGQICYSSGGAQIPGLQDILNARSGPIRRGDLLLSSKPISGGYVLWQDDVKRISEVTQQLSAIRAELRQDNRLLQTELELKQNRAKTEEMTQLYDRITRDVAPQLNMVDSLLKQAKDSPPDCPRALARVCAISAYIKRRGNLILLSQQSASLPLKELEYCLHESLDNLRLGGVYTSLNAKTRGEAPLAQIHQAYDLYEAVVERLYDRITALLVHLSDEPGGLRLRLQIGCDEPVAIDFLSHLTVSGGALSWDAQDEDIVVDLLLGGGPV